MGTTMIHRVAKIEIRQKQSVAGTWSTDIVLFSAKDEFSIIHDFTFFHTDECIAIEGLEEMMALDHYQEEE